MAITIKLAGGFNGGGALYAACQTFEQSKWLGDRGWWFYGQRTDPGLAAKLRAAGIPINTRWLPATKKEVAAAVLGAEGVEWAPEARALVLGAAQAQEASRAVDAEIDIPCPPGLAYRPYQKAGVKFALDAFARGQRGVLLGHEMGLGKTMMALGVMAISDPASVLVLCPASLRVNWLRETEKWIPARRGAIHVINGDGAVPASGVAVVNYDKLSGRGARPDALRAALLERTWDLVVADEAHMLKNEKAQRTQAVFGVPGRRGEPGTDGIVHRAGRVLLLTGTPIQNKIRESLPLLRAIGAIGEGGIEKSDFSFLYRYCGPAKVWTGRKTVTTFDGAERLPELQAKLRAGWMARCLKLEVEAELPPKLRSVVFVPCDDPALAVDPDDARRVEADLQKADDFVGAVGRLSAEKMGFAEMSAYRARLAACKAPIVCAHVVDLLDEDPKRKVLVFGHHRVLLEALASEFNERCIKITGEVPPGERQALVDRFQDDPEVRVAVLSTHAAGVGLTLTAANHEVMAEPDWNPAWCVQAEDRAHRIGQTAEKLPIEYLVLDGTLDAYVVQTMVAKMDVADRALDRRTEAGKAPAAPPPPVVPKPGDQRLVAVGKNGETRTYRMTDDRREAARQALLVVAGRCDGARARDDQGFDGRDARSEFVQALVARAESGAWSDRDGALALKVLVKYTKTQVPEFADRLFPAGEGSKS